MIKLYLPDNLIDYPISKINDKKGYIYFLFDDKNKLLYVGQTIYLESRVFNHLKNNEIPFSKCKYIECERCEMNEIEFEFIVVNSPPYNGPPPISRKWFSLDQAKRKFPNFKGKISLLKKELKKLQAENFHGYYRLEDLISIHTSAFGGV